MDEKIWLTIGELQPLYQYVSTRISNRKKRLFAVACCRAIWPWIEDDGCRKAVEAAERYADGKIGIGELDKAMCGAEDVDTDAGCACFNAARCYDVTGVTEAPGSYVDADSAAAFALDVHREAARESLEDATLFQCKVFRDIVGNPFRLVSIDPSWLTSGVTSLARANYDDRTFDRMPILADALEEAGCSNEELLAHCRGPGPHVRGCWVVDLLLGKE